MSRRKAGSTQKYILSWMRMIYRSALLLQRVPELIAKRTVRQLTGSGGSLLTDRDYDMEDILRKGGESC